MKTVSVLCATNPSYVMPLCVTLASLVANFDTRRRMDIHIVERDLSAVDRDNLRQSVTENAVSKHNIRIVWHAIDPVLLRSDLPGHRRLSADAMSRLSAPQLFPNEDRVLYLDCDLVVLSNVGELYDLPEEELAGVHAAHEVGVPLVSSDIGLTNYRQLGLRAEAPFFNSGIMLINLKYWREHDVSERALAYLRAQSGVVSFLDQRALNAVMADRWHPLDHRWNQSWTALFPELWERNGYSLQEWRRAFRHPYIVHYAGDDKPWDLGHFAPRSSFFFQYLKRTPYAGKVKQNLAARLESIIGLSAYHALWRFGRKSAYWIAGQSFLQVGASGSAGTQGVSSAELEEAFNYVGGLNQGRPPAVPVQEPVPVLCAANSKYTMPLCVMLASLVSNCDRTRGLIIHILTADLTPEDRNKVRLTLEMNHADPELVKVVWHDLDPEIMRGLPTHSRISADVFSRLLAPKLLPDCQRIVHLDCDLVVLDDVGRLYDLTEDPAILHAAQEVSIPFLSSGQGVFNYRELGFAPDLPYFNMGISIFNLDRWRKEKVAERAFAYLREHVQKVILVDQGALNALLVNEWLPIDHVWNQGWAILFPKMWTCLGISKDEWRYIRDHPSIVHYGGEIKPWDPGFRSPRSSFFFRYLARTPFKGKVRKNFAARIEETIGLPAFYKMWTLVRHLRCWLKGKKFEDPLS